MKIKELKLKNYRNYREQTFSFETNGAIISGLNGCGKTNLLEAIAYFSNGKSVLGLKDSSLVHFAADFFRLSAKFSGKETEMLMEAAVDNDNKQIKVNNVLLKRISELYSYVKTIYFSPQDVQLLEGAPAKRRNFFDFAISQLDFNYVLLFRQYTRILQQRNALLKASYEQSEKILWDDEFVKSADKVTKQRLHYLEKILPLIQKKYEYIVQNKETVSLQYTHSFSFHKVSYAEALKEKLEKNEKIEKRNERTMFGPHLSDIVFLLNDKPIRYYGSQGQKRSLAIALSLAQAELIERSHWGNPILMFDDVLADLDSDRSERSIQLLGNKHQIFIATPHKEQYRNIDLPIIELDKAL